MKKANLFLTMLFVLIIFNVSARPGGNSQGGSIDDGWQLAKEERGVKFYVKIESCSGSTQKYFQLRVENTNINVVKVNYSLVPLDLPASAPVYGVIEALAPGSSVETDCTDANDKMRVAMFPPATTIADLIILCNIE